jgi:hypothetical protein
VTTTATPYRSTQQPGPYGFRHVLHAEWTKFRTVRGWVLGLAGAILVVLLVTLLATIGGNFSGRGQTPPSGPDGQAVNDDFYTVHQTVPGDGSITVSVASLTGVVDQAPSAVTRVNPWAKAGLIVKDGLRPGSPYAAVMATGGHGVRMQYDFTHDTAAASSASAVTYPRWLRLTRSGDTVTGYESADGTGWSEVGSARLAGLPSTVEVGLFVTSPGDVQLSSRDSVFNPAVATASFDHLTMADGWTAGNWTGTQVGNAGTSGSYTANLRGGYTPAASGDGFTVTGAGDIAPVVGGVALGLGRTLTDLTVGAFAGIIVLIVIATLSGAAEYRRNLLRITLTASPSRGRVLVAKAVVLGGVAFAGGLVATAAAVALGSWRARSNGFFVLPVTSWTELRVIVGTAALFGLSAVLALAVSALLRRSAATGMAVIAAVILPYALASAGLLPETLSEWVLRVTPAAGFAIQQSVPRYEQVFTNYTAGSGSFPLPPWAGLAVLAGYTLLAFAAAVRVLRRRDA